MAGSAAVDGSGKAMRMATILKFELRPRPASGPGTARGAEDEAGRGEIVIFPGVRLQRHCFQRSDRLPDPEPGRPGVRRRRRTRGI